MMLSNTINVVSYKIIIHTPTTHYYTIVLLYYTLIVQPHIIEL